MTNKITLPTAVILNCLFIYREGFRKYLVRRLCFIVTQYNLNNVFNVAFTQVNGVYMSALDICVRNNPDHICSNKRPNIVTIVVCLLLATVHCLIHGILFKNENKGKPSCESGRITVFVQFSHSSHSKY